MRRLLRSSGGLTLLLTLYGAGLRRSEVAHLSPGHSTIVNSHGQVWSLRRFPSIWLADTGLA